VDPRAARIRIARDGDVPAILELMRPYYAEDGYPFDRSVAAKVLRAFLRRPPWGRAWVATKGSGIVGYAVVTLGYSLEYGGRDGFLDEIVVRPEWRGRGVGGALLAAAEAFCRRRGLRALHLEVEKHRQAAIGFYRKAGFGSRGRVLLTKVLGRRAVRRNPRRGR
jgi:ribosomal protein S18 acetylase RimI-like enzyme